MKNYQLGRLAPSTISTAQNSGLYTEEQINYMTQTQTSVKPEDVIIHRGIETTLKNKLGFNSPSYVDNNKIIHEFDNKPHKVPKHK